MVKKFFCVQNIHSCVEVIGVNLGPKVKMRLTTAVMEAGVDCDTGSNDTKLQSRDFVLRAGWRPERRTS